MVKSISSLVQLIWWQLLIAAPVIIHGAPKLDSNLVVNTTIGDVQGFLKYTFFKGVGYESYRGIPYAEPPVGDLRFKAPKPKAYTKTLHGSSDKYGDSCIEMPQNLKSKKARSENCLFLNIFKPVNVTKGEKLPVLFFIHGGSFFEGDGTDSYYGPDFLMEKGGVILVTINYRLNVFGFLRVDDDDMTGNMALKDAKLALRWTHDNIEKFGGDKDCITAMGQSSGGISAHHLLLNEESELLLKRIAALSGNALLVPPDMTYWNHQSFLFKKFAKQLNNKRDVDKLKKFLKNAPVEEIQKLGCIGECDGTNKFLWAAIVEKKTDKNPNPFFTEHPQLIYNKININKEVMFGVTSLEWAAFLDEEDYKNFLEQYNYERNLHGVNFDEVDYSCKMDGFQDALKAAYSLLLHFYFKNKTTLMDCEDTRKTYLKMMSDQGHAIPVDMAVQRHSEKSNQDTYYCYFDVDLELNYWKQNKSWKVPGAAHSEDIPHFMFATKLMKIYEELESNSDAKFVKTMAACRFMTDFIVEYVQTGFKGNKHGYKPVSAKPRVMNGIHITNDGPKPIVDPNKKSAHMWNKAYKLLKKFITYK